MQGWIQKAWQGARVGEERGVLFPLLEGPGEGARKNDFFLLDVACFGEFWVAFLSVLCPVQAPGP